jgi:hypothetical protein
MHSTGLMARHGDMTVHGCQSAELTAATRRTAYAGRLARFFLLAAAVLLAHGCDRPGIAFSEVAFDFGPSAPGATLTHNFAFKNTGGAPLKIIKIHAG